MNCLARLLLISYWKNFYKLFCFNFTSLLISFPLFSVFLRVEQAEGGQNPSVFYYEALSRQRSLSLVEPLFAIKRAIDDQGVLQRLSRCFFTARLIELLSLLCLIVVRECSVIFLGGELRDFSCRQKVKSPGQQLLSTHQYFQLIDKVLYAIEISLLSFVRIYGARSGMIQRNLAFKEIVTIECGSIEGRANNLCTLLVKCLEKILVKKA